MWNRNMFFYFLFYIIFGVCSSLISNYISTSVLEELESCVDAYSNSLLYQVPSFSLLRCSISCSTNDKCRRFMFDRKTKYCSLFESGQNCFTYTDISSKICFRQKSLCGDTNCMRCPIGYYGNFCENIITDCRQGFVNQLVQKKRMLSFIRPDATGPVVEAKCDFQYGGQMLIQHRMTKCKEMDSNRTWNEYLNGFGMPHGEYWLGLKHVRHALSYYSQSELVIVFMINSGWHMHFYKNFKLQDEAGDYRISLSGKNPLVTVTGDSILNGSYSINGTPFSTFDRDYSGNDCPLRFKCGWWYLNIPACSRANINGKHDDPNPEAQVHWLDNLGWGVKFHEIIMKIRFDY